jgi:hypothetical protein
MDVIHFSHAIESISKGFNASSRFLPLTEGCVASTCAPIVTPQVLSPGERERLRNFT